MNKKLSVIILAAGKGKRMNSNLPKVLHKLANKPLVNYVIDSAKSLEPEKIILVIGHKYNLMKQKLENHGIHFVLQKEQLGTGHAVLQCKDELESFNGSVLVLSGDVPLISSETLQKLISTHLKNNASATILSAIVENSKGYGRIIRDKANRLEYIVEEKDANNKETKIKEINSGIYIFKSKILFKLLPLVGNNNNQKEYYLPDVLSLILAKKGKVAIEKTKNISEIQGINSMQQLKTLEEIFK